MSMASIGLVVNMLGSILVSIEFAGIKNVQSLLKRVRDYSSLVKVYQLISDMFEGKWGKYIVLAYLLVAHITTSLELTHVTKWFSLFHSIRDIKYLALANDIWSLVYIITVLWFIRNNLFKSRKLSQFVLIVILFLAVFFWPYIFMPFQLEPYYYFINIFSLWLPFMFLSIFFLLLIVLPPLS